MRLSVRLLRIGCLLALVIFFLIAGAEVAGHFVGHRVYLLNSTRCDVAVMEEHEGVTAKPSETVLVKPGLIDRTPTKVITAGPGILLGGLHFGSAGKLEVRGQSDIKVPASWFEETPFGTKLTYELTADGTLMVRIPAGLTESSKQQPTGLPLKPHASAKVCANAY